MTDDSRQSMIHIGNNISKASAESLTERITDLYRAAAELRISDSVLIHSITALVSVTEVKNISISDSSFVSHALPQSNAEEVLPEK